MVLQLWHPSFAKELKLEHFDAKERPMNGSRKSLLHLVSTRVLSSRCWREQFHREEFGPYLTPTS
jgi:hypothetical protein